MLLDCVTQHSKEMHFLSQDVFYSLSLGMSVFEEMKTDICSMLCMPDRPCNSITTGTWYNPSEKAFCDI